MTIRTISQLPQVNPLPLSSWIEASVPNDTTGSTYVSRKVRYNDVRSDIHNYTLTTIVNNYGLKDESGNISLSAIKN